MSTNSPRKKIHAMYFNTYFVRLYSRLKAEGTPMNDYNFLADVLDTFQSMDDWLKALALLIPPGFVLGLVGLFLRHRATIRAIEAGRTGEFMPTAQDVFDRVDYLRNAAIPFEGGEVFLAEPPITIRRRN
jgi:hypothetical protein